MIDLNNLEEIKKLDPKNALESTEMFADQCQQIIDAHFEQVAFDSGYKNIDNIVICGMGGSAYGAHIAKALYHEQLKVPFVLVSDYHLPGFVNQSSLVLLTSYSGSTEEVLNCAQEAVAKRAKITGLCSGGKLGEFLKNKYPALIFNPKFNPSGQPRLGTGYIVVGTITLLSRLGVIPIAKNEVLSSVLEVQNAPDETKANAMELARKLYGTIPLIFAAEHLKGNAHILRNQFNETAKSFSSFHIIPEANHHLLEGLKNPKDRKLVTLFLDSGLYDVKIQKRVELTKDVVEQNKISVLSYKALGTSKLSQALEFLAFGGYLTFYTAILYGQNPSLIPWVNYFKTELAKS